MKISRRTMRHLGGPGDQARVVQMAGYWISVPLILFVLVGGCEGPGSLGRFRATPVTTIILDELGVVDEKPEVYANAREPRAEDLQPIEKDYVIEAGDVLDITVYELFSVGIEWDGRRQVSDTGRVTLPIIGTFRAAGRTELELTDDIKQLLSPQIIKDPKVSVIMVGSRERVYSISGAVASPNRYPINEVDFRISEAFAQSGGIPQYNADYAYVVRTLNADDLQAMSSQSSAPESNLSPSEDLSPVEPVTGDQETPNPPVKPESRPANVPPEKELLDSVAPLSSYVTMVDMGQGPTKSQHQPQSLSREKSVDLTATDLVDKVQLAANESVETSGKRFKITHRDDQFELVPKDGKTFESQSSDRGSVQAPGGTEEPLPPSAPATGRGVSEVGHAGRVQEVIRIDLIALQGGDLSQNIVIRPGDEIRIPYNAVGVFYVMGQVSRPGPYSLTGSRMTLKRALSAAGPLTPVAWPSRCEITRIIGKNTEVIYQVNLEKLLEGAAPDVFIKPDDVINIGTHPVAQWVAVIRQSFRFTYGFGFVYDRNFADKDAGH